MSFKKEYEVHYYHLDQSKQISPVSILQLLEDIATSHSASVGLGLDRLMDNGTGWVLNRWLLQMNKYPGFGEKLLIETWPSKFDHFYATREFAIKDANDQILGQASSVWIYLNIHKKRPVRIPRDFEEAYGLDQSRSLDTPFQKTIKMTGTSPGINFHIRRSDIDTNGHVNNVRYVEWMLEGMPEDITTEYKLSELEVCYKKETMYGGDIYSEYQQINPSPPEYLHRIVDETKANELVLGRTVWKKR